VLVYCCEYLPDQLVIMCVCIHPIHCDQDGTDGEGRHLTSYFFVKKVHTIITYDRQALLDIRSTITNHNFDKKDDFSSISAVPLIIPDPVHLLHGLPKSRRCVRRGEERTKRGSPHSIRIRWMSFVQESLIRET
jgi:hypothetical protein